ncbi:putative D-cysteine desulfhydrase 1, mitochondrial isoform X2 [Solanum tuberosum]|uniref:putative D-cysteine desulfhydrase 1, mitochondrial isoform X2 n=1 Tax=Solanum tuberosum TaxID=4113 RepID=UPI00073A38F5|nr:PREDICTED: putative D-cysteine desulfhydrase 1, mitochondrial isoform X2 [Solanum tuberosum]
MLSCQWSSFTKISVSPFPLQQAQLNKALNLNKQCCVTKSSMEDSSSQGHQSPFQFLTKKPYEPPPWASHLSPIPSHTFSLGHFPTPIHKWNLPNLPKNTEVWLKRDDMSGMQLSGNKVRKLEFLLADAVAQGADCIVTIGGIQSNHCRATAVAAKYLNLDCYLILRTSKALTKILKEKLLNEGRKPYVIPVGGSNSLGTWGYIEAIRELEQQLQHLSIEQKFDDIVVACGSGGTVAGLSIASMLSGLKAKINAFCVCDDPDYFYEYVQGLLDGITAGVSSRDIVSIETAKGLGYAMSTADELKFVKQVAETTGVILDPVYSGKAAYGMMKDMSENPTKWEGRKILFIHTGGLLGLYDKADEIGSLMGKWRKMDINESIPRQDGIGKMF